MKRPLALVLTIVIFAAIAVCFLRPGDPDAYSEHVVPNPDFGYSDRIYRFSTEEELDFDGSARGKIKLTDRGLGVSFFGFGREFAFESLDPDKRYLTGSEYSYVCGTSASYGNIYRENGELLREASSLSTVKLFSNVNYIESGKQTIGSFETTVAEPGRYLAVMNIYNADTDEKFEIEYPFEIPERTASRYDVMAVDLTRGPRDPNLAILSAVIRINDGGKIRVTDDPFRFERLTGHGYEPVKSSDERPAARWGMFADRNVWDDTNYDFPDVPIYGINAVAMSGWNEHDEYRLSIDLADDEGEQYTLTLRLRFGK